MGNDHLPPGLVPRVPQLDGLRGIAAVTVVVLHLHLAFQHTPPKWFLLPFFSGHQAVILFFVLSGYVLSLPFWAGKRLPYLGYALSRLARIYIPFFAAATLSIGAAYLARNRPLYLTEWFNETWHTPLTSGTVIGQYMLGTYPWFNTALWSLRYEVQVSLLLPLLLWLANRINIVVLTAVWFVLTFRDLGMLGTALGQHALNQTLGVAALFLLGACAARYHNLIERSLRSSPATRWLLFAASLFVYSATVAMSIIANAWLPAAAASLGLILVAVSSRRIAAILSSPVCLYLGHISYSLYLTHSIVLFGLTYLLYGRIPVAVLVMLIAVTSLALADVFHRLIELPSIRFSREVRNIGGFSKSKPGAEATRS